MAESYAESDEAFARRLQAQEMGTFHVPANADAQTPLMVCKRLLFALCFTKILYLNRIGLMKILLLLMLD